MAFDQSIAQFLSSTSTKVFFPSLSQSLLLPPPPLSTAAQLKKKKQGYREDAGLFLESDTDEQLLINIPFTQGKER